MKIYLIRHGETQWNIEERLQGGANSPLTKKGIMDAKLLGNRLKNMGIDIIYSSISSRAIHTSKIIKAKRDIKIIGDKTLKEMDIGNWEGKTWNEIKIKNPQEYSNYWNYPHLYIGNNGGEDFYQVQNRAISFIDKLVQERKHENILIVSHGVILKSIITYYQNKSMDKLWDPPVIEGTSLSLIEVGEEEIKLAFLADISHLKDSKNRISKI